MTKIGSVDHSRIEAIRAAYDDCFGCGRANPIGLALDDFIRDESTVRVDFNPRPEYSGFSDVLHGGIVAAALDEIMAWTAMLLEGVMVVTGTLDLRYRKPAPVAETMTLEGELLSRRGRRLHIAGRLFHGDTRVAEAEGMFLAVDEIGG